MKGKFVPTSARDVPMHPRCNEYRVPQQDSAETGAELVRAIIAMPVGTMHCVPQGPWTPFCGSHTADQGLLTAIRA